MKTEKRKLIKKAYIGIEIIHGAVKFAVPGKEEVVVALENDYLPRSKAPSDINVLQAVVKAGLAQLGSPLKRVYVILPSNWYVMSNHKMGVIGHPKDYLPIFSNLEHAQMDEVRDIKFSEYQAEGHIEIRGMSIRLQKDDIQKILEVFKNLGLEVVGVDAALTNQVAVTDLSDYGEGLLLYHLESAGNLSYQFLPENGHENLLTSDTFNLDAQRWLTPATDNKIADGIVRETVAMKRFEKANEKEIITMEAGIRNLVSEILAWVFEMNDHKTNGQTLKKVLLSGIGTGNPYFQEMIQREMDQRNGDITLNFQPLSGAQTVLKRKANAAIGFNLINGDLKLNQKGNSYLILPAALLGTAAALTAGLWLYNNHIIQEKTTANQQLSQKKDRIAVYVNYLQSKEAQSKAITSLLEQEKILPENQIHWSDYLKRVLEQFPPSSSTIAINRIDLQPALIKRDSIEAERYQGKTPTVIAAISGTANSRTALTSFMRQLELAKDFGISVDRVDYKAKNGFSAFIGVQNNE